MTGSIFFTGLEINDGCVITFDPASKHAEVIVEKLTLHGKARKAPSLKPDTEKLARPELP